MKKSIYQMHLHETVLTDFGIVIMRVPGGWLYDCWDTAGEKFKCGLFIEYHNEFIGKESAAKHQGYKSHFEGALGE